MKMWKHAETFYANKDYKLAYVVFITTSSLLCYTFQTLFARKRGFAYPCALQENESLQHCLSCDVRKMITFLLRSEVLQALSSSFPDGSIFRESLFSQIQGPCLLFRLCSQICVRPLKSSLVVSFRGYIQTNSKATAEEPSSLELGFLGIYSKIFSLRTFS